MFNNIICLCLEWTPMSLATIILENSSIEAIVVSGVVKATLFRLFVHLFQRLSSLFTKLILLLFHLYKKDFIPFLDLDWLTFWFRLIWKFTDWRHHGTHPNSSLLVTMLEVPLCVTKATIFERKNNKRILLQDFVNYSMKKKHQACCNNSSSKRNYLVQHKPNINSL